MREERWYIIWCLIINCLSLPAKLVFKARLCKSLAKQSLDEQKVGELLRFSNKVIYQGTGSTNRYFLIQEPV